VIIKSSQYLGYFQRQYHSSRDGKDFNYVSALGYFDRLPNFVCWEVIQQLEEELRIFGPAPLEYVLAHLLLGLKHPEMCTIPCMSAEDFLKFISRLLRSESDSFWKLENRGRFFPNVSKYCPLGYRTKSCTEH